MDSYSVDSKVLLKKSDTCSTLMDLSDPISKGSMCGHMVTTAAPENVITRTKHPSESENFDTPLVQSGPNAKNFSYWPGSDEILPEEPVKQKDTPTEPQPPCVFSSETIVELLKSANTIIGKKVLSGLGKRIKSLETFLECKDTGDQAESQRLLSTKKLTHSASNLLEVSTRPEIKKEVKTQQITKSDVTPQVIVTLAKDVLSSEAQPKLCKIPGELALQADPAMGEYCIPVNASFSMNDKPVNLTNQSFASVLEVLPLPESLTSESASRSESKNKKLFKETIARSDFTLQVQLNEKNLPLYSSAVDAGAISEKQKKKGKSKSSFSNAIAESAALKIDELLPGSEDIVFSLVNKEMLEKASQVYANDLGFGLTSEVTANVSSKYTLTAINPDEFRLDAVAIFNGLYNQSAYKTQKGCLETSMSIRMVRENGVWTPKGCHCSFDLDSDGKFVTARLKKETGIQKSYAEQQKFGKRQAQKQEKLFKGSLSSIPVDLTPHAEASGYPLRKKETSKSLGSGLNLTVTPAKAGSLHMRQYSEPYEGLHQVVHGAKSSSSLLSSKGSSLTIPDSDVSSSSHSRQSSSVSSISHSRQDSYMSDISSDSNSLLDEPKPELFKSSLVKMGTQHVLSNLSEDTVQKAIMNTPAFKEAFKEGYKKKLKDQKDLYLKSSRFMTNDRDFIAAQKLSREVNQMGRAAPQQELFDSCAKNVLENLVGEIPEMQEVDSILSDETLSEQNQMNADFTADWLAHWKRVETEVDQYNSPKLSPELFSSLSETQKSAVGELLETVKSDCEALKKLTAEIKGIGEEAGQNPEKVMAYLEKIARIHCRSIEIIDDLRATSRSKGKPKLKQLEDAVNFSATPELSAIQRHFEILKVEMITLKAMLSTKTKEVLIGMQPAEKDDALRLQKLGYYITSTVTTNPADILESPEYKESLIS